VARKFETEYRVARNTLFLAAWNRVMADLDLRLHHVEVREGSLRETASRLEQRFVNFMAESIGKAAAEIETLLDAYREGVPASQVTESTERRFLSTAEIADLQSRMTEAQVDAKDAAILAAARDADTTLASALRGGAAAGRDTLRGLSDIIDLKADAAATATALGAKLDDGQAGETGLAVLGAQSRLAGRSALAAASPTTGNLGFMTNPNFSQSQEAQGEATLGGYPADGWYFQPEGVPMTAQTVGLAQGLFAGLPGRLLFGAKVTVNTAKPTFAAAETSQPFNFFLEGTFTRFLRWGTTSARGLKFVGVLQASVAGLYPITVLALDASGVAQRHFTKLLALASTPTLVIFDVPPLTGFAPSESTTRSISINVAPLAGSDQYATTLDAWAVGSKRFHASCVNWAATAGATVTISYLDVLPAGIVPWATAAEVDDDGMHNLMLAMSFEQQQARCHRYWWSTYEGAKPGTIADTGAVTAHHVLGTANIGVPALNVTLPPQMRARPGITFYSNVSGLPNKVRDTTAAVDRDVSTIFYFASKCTGYPVLATAPSNGNLITAHVVASSRLL